MTSAWDTAVQKLESKMLQRMLVSPTRKHVNNMRGAIAAVYAEANTSHDSFPLGSNFGFLFHAHTDRKSVVRME